MKPWLRWTLLIGGAVLAVVLIAAGVLTWLVLRLDVRAEVERAVEASTGRDATISGSVGVSYWPVLGLRAHDVTLANVQGGRAPAFIAAEEIDIGVQIRPLFDRRVVVQRLVLQRPQISLEVDAEGRPNWVLQARRPEGPAPTPQTEAPVNVSQTQLREVRVSDGEMSFFDARTGSGWVVGDVDVRTAFDGLDQPVEVQGSLRYADRPIELELTLGRPGAAMRGELTPISLKIESELVNADFQGQTIAGSGELAGTVQAAGPSLRQLAAWVGSPIQGGVGFEQFAVSGRLQISGGAYAFSNAGFVLDMVRGRGDFVLSEREGRPYLSGRLELFDFDMNPYLTGTPPPRAPADEVVAAAAAPAEHTLTAETAVAAAAPEARRAVDVRAAASDTLIDFSGLKAFDADLELATHAVLVQRTQIDSAHANLVLNNGYLAATLHNVTLYGGSGRGRFEIDAREADTRIVQDMAFSGLDARRFLTDTVNYSNIEGRAELSINIRAVGRTQSDFIEALDGRTHVEVISGTLHGVDLGGVSTTIRNALRGELIAPEARTPFQGFSATFAISNGVLATDDLSFNTPDLRIPGIGLIDVPNRRLDMRLAPRSPRGGVVVPFSVRGPFGQFEYASDIRDRAQREIIGRVRAVEAAARAPN